MNRAKQIYKAAEEEENRFGSVDTIGAAFRAGAMWADSNPQSLWVSIKDKKPEQYEEVLLCVPFSNREGDCAYYLADYNERENGKSFWNGELLYLPSDGTEYWRPIPKIPTEQIQK